MSPVRHGLQNPQVTWKVPDHGIVYGHVVD